MTTRSAIVMGASRGLGRAVALAVAQRAGTVHLIARDAADLAVVGGHVRPQPGHAAVSGRPDLDRDPGAAVTAPGDVAECRIPGIGSLINTVVAADDSRATAQMKEVLHG